MTLAQWQQRVQARSARVGIVGLGYVGLPLALLFAEDRFVVTGFDIDREKVRALAEGRSYIQRIGTEEIAAAQRAGFNATTDFAEAAGCDALLICVPTPLGASSETEGHTPDLSFVEDTLHALAPHLRAGQLVVLESTTYPGTTNDLVVPLLERAGVRVLRGDAAPPDADLDGVMVAFSPEREDPGNTDVPRRAIPKVLGGVDARATAAAEALYGAVFARTVAMSSPAAAEMTKLLENIYRVVNIALVNELKQFCLATGIDIWEVIAAASTKPFGFAPFQPGPGIGGHCIPVDPFYLSWRAQQLGLPTRFIQLAGEVNEAMPAYVVETVRTELAARGVVLTAARILLLGMAYKRDIDDLRESPALTVFTLLRAAGAEVAYNDPYFAHIGRGRKYDVQQSSVDLARIGDFDCVVLLTDHTAYDARALAAQSKLFVDTRNATRGVAAANVVRC
jgi:UDP-N-acetyl-D-glucosamine dehydrogenase